MGSGSTWQGKGELVSVDSGNGEVWKLTQVCVLIKILGPPNPKHGRVHLLTALALRGPLGFKHL